MPPSRWDDEEDDSTPPSSPPPQITRRSKFDDEEDEDDVLESWDAAEDSEAEREKAKKEAEAKAAAEAKARANHKSKSQRIEEHRMEKMRQRQAEEDEGDSDSEEDEADRRARLLREQKESDLKHAEELFGGVGGVSDRRAQPKAVTLTDPSDPSKAIELSSLKIFDPQSREQFAQLRETVGPLISRNAKKAQYSPFMTEFAKDITKELPSEQIKKIASALTALSNEKLKEEKAADKGGKKSKAQKTKTTLNASRGETVKADTSAYDDGLDEDDFM